MKPLTPNQRGFFDIFTEISGASSPKPAGYFDTEMLQLDVTSRPRSPGR